MTIQSIIVLVIVFVLLALAIMFICQHGGWRAGWGGTCAACPNKCATPKPKDQNKS